MSSPHSLAHSLARSPVDFVGNDVDALASHMRHCAVAHGRWFALRSKLQRAHALAAGHIVTMACGAVLLAVGAMALA
jgi:hypothetical protein